MALLSRRGEFGGVCADCPQGARGTIAPAEVDGGFRQPGRKCLHTAAYDAARYRMVMYVGQRTGPLDDL